MALLRSATLPDGSVFLVRCTRDDWNHTGFVTVSHADAFDTIEGNANDDGNRKSYEVCARPSAYSEKDSIVLQV